MTTPRPTRCKCCGDDIPATATTLICPPCFQALSLYGTQNKFVRCPTHQGIMDPTTMENPRR